MKNLICTTFLLIAATFQAQEASTFRFGAKAGMNLTGYSTSEGTDNDNIGFNVGGVAEYRLNNTLALQGEIMFNQKGGLYQIGTVPYHEFAKMKLSYINVPVLVKLKVLSGLNVEVGPQIGFLVGEKLDIGSTEFEAEGTKSVDVELIGGLSYEFNNGIFLQARYLYGAVELYDDRPYRNSGLSFSLGYFFN